MYSKSKPNVTLDIQYQFQTLIELLRPKDRELVMYGERIERVQNALNRVDPESFSILFGSYNRRTAIRNSDIDVLWFISPDWIVSKNTFMPSIDVLKRIKTGLSHILPNEQINISPPALLVRYGNDPFEINIVPGGPKNLDDYGVENPGAMIPDENDGWMLTAPKAQESFLNNAYMESNDFLKYVARFLKFWRTRRREALHLPSFYVEFVLALSGSCNCFSFSEAVWKSFAALHSSVLTGVDDPLGISGRIWPSQSSRQLARLESAFRTASGYATKAYLAEMDGNEELAFANWNKAFGGGFPGFKTHEKNLGWGRHDARVFPETEICIPEIFL